MYPLFRMEYRGHLCKRVKVGEAATLGEARAFLQQNTDAGHAGVFFEYPRTSQPPIPDRHADKRVSRIPRVQTWAGQHRLREVEGRAPLSVGGAS